MKRFKKGFALIFAMVMALSVFPSAPNVFADDIAKIKVSVQGDGVITISDTKSEYKINQGEVFKASVNVGSKLTLKMDANEGSLLGQVVLNGQNALGIETDTKSVSYDYVIQAGGADIKANFIVDPNHGVGVETPNAGENTTTETPKEEVNEEVVEPKEEVKEETPVEEESLELKIIREYVAGIKNTEEQIAFRKNLATEKNLLEFVDENFFLTGDFISSKSSAYFIDEGIVTLIPSLSSAELEEFANTLSTGIGFMSDRQSRSSSESFSKETRENLYTGGGQGVSTDYLGYTVTAPMLTVGGRQAFCIEFEKTTPNPGTLVTDKQESSNDMLRKMLYYGYRGPGSNQLAAKWTGNQTLLMIATTMAASKANGHDFYRAGEHLYADIEGLPVPPSEFTVYTVSTGGGTQDLAFWDIVLPSNGMLQISKVSAKPEITDGNDYYSVVGAEYGVYATKNGDTLSDHKGTLVIGENGFSGELDLPVGTYYIKETKAPKGYALDTQSYDVSINPDKKAQREFKDYPTTDPVNVSLQKVDAETGLPVAVGEGTLKDAHYTFKFYKGEYGDGVNPADLGESPDRTWVFKTNEDGKAFLLNSYKVSGDELYTNSLGIPTLPYGTVTVQETKPPMGYQLDKTLHVRRITPVSGNTDESVNSYNIPVSKEPVIRFTIEKVQGVTNTPIPGTRFTHTKPNGSTEVITTDAQGYVQIVGPETGIHKIKENQVRDGYDLNPHEFQFRVNGDGTITPLTNITSNMGMKYTRTSDGNASLQVANMPSQYDIKLNKVNDHQIALDGAEFTMYSDSACTKELSKQVTKNGSLVFKDLTPDVKYYIKETKAPQGYRIPVDAFGRVHVYEVYSHSVPVNGVFDFFIDGKKYTTSNTSGDIHLEGTVKDRVVTFKVVNPVGMKLPVTGSDAMIPLMVVGAALMGLSIYAIRKKKSKTK